MPPFCRIQALKKRWTIADDIRSTIMEMDISNATNGELDKISVSIGVSTYPFHANDNIMLADRAHEKMFEAREKGGNRVMSV